LIGIQHQQIGIAGDDALGCATYGQLKYMVIVWVTAHRNGARNSFADFDEDSHVDKSGEQAITFGTGNVAVEFGTMEHIPQLFYQAIGNQEVIVLQSLEECLTRLGLRE
jgi:hypothetical protein